MRCRKEQKEEKMITVNGKEVKDQEEQTVASGKHKKRQGYFRRSIETFKDNA